MIQLNIITPNRSVVEAFSSSHVGMSCHGIITGMFYAWCKFGYPLRCELPLQNLLGVTEHIKNSESRLSLNFLKMKNLQYWRLAEGKRLSFYFYLGPILMRCILPENSYLNLFTFFHLMFTFFALTGGDSITCTV